MNSLYRSYLRQVRALPHVYLRIKAADDFRSVLETKSVQLRTSKLRRLSKDLRRLREANQGKSTAFDRVLDTAYGRVGKLRWELMEPLLLDSTPQTIPRRAISSPTYSPELVALLTSSVSRTTRALQKHHLDSPPGLPRHAQSKSKDAMLLGPLSKRREHNIRWRFFRSEWKKVYPPLQISSQHSADHANTHVSSNPTLHLGFQNTSVLQELFVLAGSPSSSPEPTSKQRKLKPNQETSTSHNNPFDGNLPLRWLRRRYQALLSRLPLLMPRSDNSKRVYDIQLAESAIASRPHPPRLRVTNEEDISWIDDIRLIAQSGRHRT